MNPSAQGSGQGKTSAARSPKTPRLIPAAQPDQRTYTKLVLFALSKNRYPSYTIRMKTKKLPLTILFGLFLAVSGGVLFAGEKPAFETLKAGPWGTGTDVKIELPPPGSNDAKIKAALTKDTKGADTKVGDVKAAEPPAPPPTFKEQVKEFVGEHKTQIFAAGLGGYLGFALLGPVGILLGAVFLLSVMYVAGA